MDMRDYSTLHLDINLSKGTALLLLFCILYFCFEGTIGVIFFFFFNNVIYFIQMLATINTPKVQAPFGVSLLHLVNFMFVFLCFDRLN
jgi:hypothetical protein